MSMTEEIQQFLVDLSEILNLLSIYTLVDYLCSSLDKNLANFF